MTDVWARTPLRIKLVAALCALVTAALALAGFAAVHALRGYLVDRVDAQLSDVASASLHERGGGDGSGGPPSDFDGDGPSSAPVSQFYVTYLGTDGTQQTGRNTCLSNSTTRET